MTATNVEVVKNQNEPNMNLIRRFTRKIQSAGTLKHVKKQRFFEREESKFKKKAHALKRLAKQKEIERLRKLGKIK